MNCLMDCTDLHYSPLTVCAPPNAGNPCLKPFNVKFLDLFILFFY